LKERENVKYVRIVSGHLITQPLALTVYRFR